MTTASETRTGTTTTSLQEGDHYRLQGGPGTAMGKAVHLAATHHDGLGWSGCEMVTATNGRTAYLTDQAVTCKRCLKAAQA